MTEDNIKQTDKKLPYLYDKPENCCGCGACFSVCPCKAITMEPDMEGFLYPKVNDNKCIRCYQCEKVCPIKYAEKKGHYNKTFPNHWTTGDPSKSGI